MGHVKIKRKEGLLLHPVCTIVTCRQFEIVQVLKNFSTSRISNISLYNYISLFKIIPKSYSTPAGVYTQFNQRQQNAAVFLSTV